MTTLTDPAPDRSTGGRLGGWTGTDYSAAKAAVIQLTRSAAVELGEHGIRVNSVSPGPVPTGIFGKAAGMDPAAADRTAIQLEPAFLAALENHQPIRRAGTPEDVAQVMLWLASDASSFVNGQDIAVDGGRESYLAVLRDQAAVGHAVPGRAVHVRRDRNRGCPARADRPVRRRPERGGTAPGRHCEVSARPVSVCLGRAAAHRGSRSPTLQSEIDSLELNLGRSLHSSQLLFSIRRMDTVHNEVQQAIRPQAVALAVFGILAALAMLVLVGQGLAQLLSRSAGEISGLRAVGAARGQAALAAGLEGGIAVVAGVVLSVVGAYAVSPLAPVGPVRRFDPARGFEADPLVLAGGGVVLALVLLGVLAVLAWRTVRPAGRKPAVRPSVIAVAAAAAGLPVSAVIGARHALERGSGPRPAAVRASLAGSAAAVTAVVMAAVFGASLNGLASHPARYGWNWDLLIQAEGGYGNWKPAVMDQLVDHQPGVTGWSQFAFSQVLIDGREVPVMGLQREVGSVEPPTTSGHPIAGPGQIELGTSTLRQLGKQVGGQVRVGTGKTARTLTIVGTVALPSFGLIFADHVSLGRGALLPESTLLAIQDITAGVPSQQAAAAFPAFPSAVAIDMAPGTAADARRLVSRIASADPDGSPGSTYPLGPQRGAAILNAAQMGSQPLALAIGLAAAAVLALALTVLASVRQRRRQLAVLKALGLRRGQLRAIVAWQVSVILVIAAAIGVPAGVAAGRWAWATFGGVVGFVPVSVVPVLPVALGSVALLAAGNLLAVAPALIAARTPPAAALRAE